MDRSQQHTFLALRRKLSELNYTESFGVDAIDLVERLVNDLVETTNSYKHVQEKESRLSSDLALAQAQLFPLRKENARLARENHELHIDSIRQNDEIRNSLEEYGRNTRRLQEELHELSFLADAQREELRSKNEELSRLRDAYDSVTDPSLKSLSNSASRVIKLSSKLGPSKHRRAGQAQQLNAAKADLLMGAAGAEPGEQQQGQQQQASEKLQRSAQESESIIATLREQLSAAAAALSESEEECRRLTSAVASREQELARSSKLINIVSSNYTDTNAGASAGSNALMPGNKTEQLLAADLANKRIIDQLNGQVDFLNEQLAQREAQIAETNDKMLQFDSLQNELEHRNNLLEQARREVGQGLSRVRALEQKLIDIQEARKAEAASQASYRSVPHQQQPSAESKPTSEGNEAGNGALVAKLSAERDELVQEVARLRRVVEATGSLAGSHRRGAADGGSYKAGLKLAAAATASWKNEVGGRPASSTRTVAGAGANRKTGSHSGSAGTAPDNQLILDLNSEVEALKKREHALTRGVAQRDDRVAALEEEKAQLQSRIQTLSGQQDKSQLLQLLSEAQERAAHAEQVAADSVQQREHQQAVAEAVAQELADTKHALHHATLSAEELEAKLTMTSKELSLSMDACAKQRQDLSSISAEAARLRVELADASADLEQERARVGSLQQLVAGAQQQAEQRGKEAVRAAAALAELQAGDLSGVAEQLKQDKARLRSRVTELEMQQDVWYKERRFMREVAHALGLRIGQEQELRGQLEDGEMRELLGAAQGKDAEISRLRDQLQQMQSKADRTQSTLENHEKVVTVQLTEVEELRGRCLQQDRVVSEQAADLQAMQRRCEDLRGQQEETQQQLEEQQRAWASVSQQLSTARRELQTQAEEMQRAQRGRARAEEECEELRRRASELGRRLGTEQQELKRLVAEKGALEGRVEELKALSAQQEASARAQQQQQQRLAASVERGQSDSEQWAEERQRLVQAVEERDTHVSSLKEALQALDRERDRLQELLDAEEDRGLEQQRLQQHQELQITSHKQSAEHMEHRLQAMGADLAAAQRHAAAADARLSAAQREVSELRQRLSQKSMEVGGAAEDLMLMTRENQALTSELVEVSSERDRLQQRLQEVLHASASTEHARRAAEVEKADLVNTYRAVLQEKRKLEEDLASLSSDKHREGASTQQLRDELAGLRGQLRAQTNSEARWRAERTSLLAQIETLNEQLVRSQHRIDAMEADNRRMMHDTHGLKQSNAMLNERINMIIKRAGAATEANKLLTARLGSVERERDAVRALVGIERQRASEMGSIAEAARVQAATKELHIQRLQTTGRVLSPVIPVDPLREASGSALAEAIPVGHEVRREEQQQREEHLEHLERGKASSSEAQQSSSVSHSVSESARMVRSVVTTTTSATSHRSSSSAASSSSTDAATQAVYPNIKGGDISL